MDHTEFGWLFLYVCIFGLSDYIVNRLIHTDTEYIIYYFTIGVIGFGLIYYNKRNSHLQKKSQYFQQHFQQ